VKKLALGAAAALALALPMSAQAYGGPWDSAHQPPAVTNPGVIVSDNLVWQELIVTLAPTVGCTNGVGAPVQVTFSYPAGAATDTLDPCSGIWSPGPSTSLNTLTWDGDPTLAADEPGSGTLYWASDKASFWETGATPVLYTVSGPGGVISQGAYTLHSDGNNTETIDQDHNPDGFVNTCIDGGYTIYSENGGDLYCTVSTGGDASFTAGWPAPPPPPSVSRAEGLWEVRYVVHRFSAHPLEVEVSGCRRTEGRLGWTCRASWRDRVHRYQGSVHVWQATATAKTFHYGVNFIRSKLGCTSGCTKRINFG